MLLKVVKPYSDHKMLKLLSFQNLFFSASTILLLKLIAEWRLEYNVFPPTKNDTKKARVRLSIKEISSS